MLEIALKLLKKIEKSGFSAYIVGGFVRDYIMGRNSADVDIATNATPKQLREIFPNSSIAKEAYGSITVVLKKVRFEITTFRRELTYYNNRKPIEIEYIDDLLEDLKRRDFTINTLCMDSNKNIIDLLNGRVDIDNKLIRTVGDSVEKFSEDALRILRAVRFATILNFNLTPEVYDAIIKTKKYLSNISYNRKKDELDKIFMSPNAKHGIELIKRLGLDSSLEIYNIDEIKLSTDLVGIWSSLNVSPNYPFTKAEKELMDKIKEVAPLDNYDRRVLYKYGPYVNRVAAINKGLDESVVVNVYNSLPIKAKGDINISAKKIMEILSMPPGKYLNKIYIDLENRIIDGLLVNDNKNIESYIINNYRGKLWKKTKWLTY